MCAHTLLGNREIPQSSGEQQAADRVEKSKGRTSTMHERGKSDRPVVPMKSPNNAAHAVAEVAEGRGLAKENSTKHDAFRTQSRVDAPNVLERIRQRAKRNKKEKFTALFHQVYDVERLRTAYRASSRDAAAGVDGQTWERYGEAIEDNLEDLARRLRQGAYRAKPVRRAYIPKSDGRLRPLGVPTLEDKIVQRSVVEVLNAVYERDFLGFSYGFRPGRSPHQALDALAVGIGTRRVRWVLDADIRDFFGSLSHEWLVKFVEHRIGDRRVVRLIQKWLSAGVLEHGVRTRSEVGTIQGGSISPLLANIYLHYVFDLWTQRWRTKQARGDVVVVRFADDFVVGFERGADARRFLADLRERFAKFGLSLHPDKTRLLEFGRFADQDRRRRDMGKPETFCFLGFRHMCARTQSGAFTVLRQTDKVRMRAKLQAVKAELQQRMHAPIPETGAYLRAVVTGHFRYFGVPLNYKALGTFHHSVMRLWWRVLERRSQNGHITVPRMNRLAKRWLPPPHILHPYPLVRFGVTTRGKSRMR